MLADLRAFVSAPPSVGNAVPAWLTVYLDRRNAIADLYETLESYTYCSYSVATGDETAVTALNRIAEFTVPLAEIDVRFRDTLAAAVDLVPGGVSALVEAEPGLRDYEFLLEEDLVFRTRQLSPAEEQLAADLARAGSDAWSRLQETLSSTLSVPWEDGTKTVVELRSLAHDPDRTVRERAYRAELGAWERVETSFAFAINGVKGFSHILNERRGWSSTLERTLRQSRMSEKTLEILLATMNRTIPIFRRYWNAKARALGVDRLAFFDLFAPVGIHENRWSYTDATEFIASRFDRFDRRLGDFARRAFQEEWIDAEPRAGKVGGAYCIGLPRARRSGILANFDGSYGSVETIAHELGHAYHGEVLEDLPALQRQYPMPLAETASTFCEILVFEGALEEAPATERIHILEQFLQGAGQVIVDILSRYIFESALMERRASGEASARELREMMVHAQELTYGDALDPDLRHPWMWAVKGHYYSENLAFYNFPYAFGMLFALGLSQLRHSDPEGFPDRYRAVLRETGRQNIESVCSVAGFDITKPEFWDAGIAGIENLVREFESLVD